jgi:hypothetical protein
VTGAQLGAMGTVFAIVFGVIGVVIAARSSAREAQRARRDEIAEAARVAVEAERKYWQTQMEALRADLAGMTQERDYQRKRADNLDDELRRRER